MGDVFTIAVRVKPGSSRTRVGGGYAGPHGAALVVAVTAPAVDGRATEAARRALADALQLRPATVSLRSGATSRDKIFAVDPPPPDLADRVRRLRDPSS
ncbi:DUF167 domain-containing protein [Planosporangium thailandense]|uniref:UPF0235 protein HC031_08735 n=1 Tax=Planosporangium thailandense TaxID=765197 RepID=A0ABX0XWQ2_9ACTN|nr:DUF167 domain-containing protein [Planosporangium thailandense]NJC69805.1 DUF167 domain-containing protein [Planosporangium thailandense]